MQKRMSAIDKMKFVKAKTLSRAGDISGVVEIVRELVASYPDNPRIRSVLANAYWDLGDLAASEKEFRKAVELAPVLELASLGLFHCLWEQNRRDEAFEEMKRFMSISDSADYRRIVQELTQTG